MGLDLIVNILVEYANVESVDGGPEIEQLLRQIRHVTETACANYKPRPGKIRPELCNAGDIVTFSGAGS